MITHLHFARKDEKPLGLTLEVTSSMKNSPPSKNQVIVPAFEDFLDFSDITPKASLCVRPQPLPKSLLLSTERLQNWKGPSEFILTVQQYTTHAHADIFTGLRPWFNHCLNRLGGKVLNTAAPPPPPCSQLNILVIQSTSYSRFQENRLTQNKQLAAMSIGLGL